MLKNDSPNLLSNSFTCIFSHLCTCINYNQWEKQKVTLELKDQNEIDFLRFVLICIERAPNWLPYSANHFQHSAELHAHVLLRRLLSNKEEENKCSPSS